MELKAKHFKDIGSLVSEKDNLRRSYNEHADRQKILRDFYNGQPIMTEEEAAEENVADITNHLIGFSNMQVIETRIYSMWSTSNKLIDVNVLNGDAVENDSQSSRINKYLNCAIYKTTRFGTFWRSVAGEVAMAGRAACLHKEDSDWCPSVQSKIYLPDSVGADSSELTYAFLPKELTYNQLEAMLDDGGAEESDEDDDDDVEDVLGVGVEVNEDVIKDLMATIDEQVKMDSTQLDQGSENEKPDPTNTDKQVKSNKTTVNLWYYYEVRFDEEADSKVVDLFIFSDEFRHTSEDNGVKKDGTESTHAMVAYYPAFYAHPSEWLNLIVADSSIGGDKRFATAKGIAEITYNSDVDAEELQNRLIEGIKMRAVPRMQRGSETNEDELLGWDMHKELLVPQGLTEFNFKTNQSDLAGGLALLRQNSAAQAGAGQSNTGRGEELRQQAVERQGNTQAIVSSRTSDLHKAMQIIAHEIVRRFFVGDVEGGSPGYEEIMWFRHMMKKYDIDLEKLAEQRYGFYENIEVKIVKSSTTGEIDHDVAVANQLMQNIANFPPAVRPLIVRRFTALLTGDPDFSDQLVELLPKVVNAQRVTAESEFEQIARDASVGIETELGVEDVHQEHASTHNKHLQVIINRAQFRPWTREDAAHFAGIQVHNQKHLDELLGNNSTLAEGQRLLQEFQQLVAVGDSLLKDVEQDEQQQGQQSQQEIDNEIKLREQERKEAETLIKAADTQSVIDNRKSRQDGVARKGDQQFLIQKEQLDQKARENQQQQSQT